MNLGILENKAASHEEIRVNQIRHSPIVFGSLRSPFRSRTQPVKLQLKEIPIPLLGFKKSPEEEAETEKASSSTAPSTVAAKHTLSSSAKAIMESPELDEHSIPCVAFPYILGLNKELKANFKLICEQIPPLPCELNDLVVDLLPEPLPEKRTVVIGLENTLMCLKERMGGEKEIIIRPHAENFLKKISEKFEVIIFSSEDKALTLAALNKLDPSQKYIKHVLDRRNCVERDEGLYIKDLRIIRNRNIHKMIIIDSSVFSFMKQLENGIYIPSFKGSEEDEELLTISEFLTTLKGSGDIRPIVTKFSGIFRAMKLYSKEAESEVKKSKLKEDIKIEEKNEAKSLLAEDYESDIGNEYE